MSEPVRVYPPGPFPPHGHEPEGTIDLGVRIRDQLLHREILIGPVRASLANRLQELASTPQGLVMSAHLVEPLLDTWAIGALIDDARRAWIEGPEGEALAVLARAAWVVNEAIGWTSLDRRWLLPDEEWMREQLGSGEHVVVSRGPMDGAPAVAASLDLDWADHDALDLPSLIEVPGDEIVSRREALVEQLERAEGVAVRLITPLPDDEAHHEAWRAIRELAPAQQAFDLYGYAGLVAPDAPSWDDLLDTAPAVALPERPQRACDAVILPRLNDEEQIDYVAMLVWDAPYAPVAAQPAAAEVLRELDGERTLDEIADGLGAPVELVRSVAEELASAGAVR